MSCLLCFRGKVGLDQCRSPRMCLNHDKEDMVEFQLEGIEGGPLGGIILPARQHDVIMSRKLQ